jgi:hypothetical protein
MKVLRALLLILALSVSASAGWMENDKTGNIPNVRAGEIHTDRTGDIPNDETGEMDQGNAGNMPNEVARLAWQFLHSVLPLF